MNQLTERRNQTASRLRTLRESLRAVEGLTTGKACVYATGSFGRYEASEHSDLDAFIVGKSDGNPGRDGKEGSRLNRLDEICVKAKLINITRNQGIPDFSGDGQYLAHYSAHELAKTLGTPEDDAINTFTARLLLLLESRPLLNDDVYNQITREIIGEYWRDYADHDREFMPAFLSNDILRLWRTFCVNYEARTQRDPPDRKAKGKLKNYKLKHSRLLTCYSALLYLSAVYKFRRTVTPEDAAFMIGMTPTERVEWLLSENGVSTAHAELRQVLEQYDKFLVTTNISEDKLVDKFQDRAAAINYIEEASKFGDLVFDALREIGKGTRYYRLLVV